jgi:hypothetical protein
MYFGSLDQHQFTFWDESVGNKTVNCILSAVHAGLISRATGRKTLHGWAGNTYSQLKCYLTFLYLQNS